MTRFLLPLAAILLITPAAMAETITITGQNGGTLTGTRTCDRASGQITCTLHATTTAANGATGSRNRTTTASQGTVTSILSGTRVNGRSFGRTTTITR